jgi:hypothetical protein
MHFTKGYDVAKLEARERAKKSAGKKKRKEK